MGKQTNIPGTERKVNKKIEQAVLGWVDCHGDVVAAKERQTEAHDNVMGVMKKNPKGCFEDDRGSLNFIHTDDDGAEHRFRVEAKDVLSIRKVMPKKEKKNKGDDE